MSSRPSPPPKRTTAEILCAMREGNQQSRARVLASIDRLRQIAEAKRRAARR